MNEEEYTTQIVMPLLRQVGYSEVRYNHGIAEFGKDVVFCDYDRFGNKIYYAAQIKAGDLSGNNKGKVDDIINHIDRAFNYPFDDLITKSKVMLSHFFVIISGRFTDNARILIIENLRLRLYIHRLHLYEGNHIDQLATRAFRELRFLFESQLAELSWNKKISFGIKEITANSIFTPYSTSNLTRLINALSVADSYLGLSLQLRDYQAILLRQNGLLALLPVITPIKGSADEIKLLKDKAELVEQKADNISVLIKQAINELGP